MTSRKQNFVLWRYLHLQSSKCSSKYWCINIKGTKHPQLKALKADHFTNQLEFENNLEAPSLCNSSSADLTVVHSASLEQKYNEIPLVPVNLNKHVPQ